MEFCKFKEMVKEELQDFYGKDATVSIESVLINNRERKECVNIIYHESGKNICPFIYLEGLYQDFNNGDKSFEQCIRTIIQLREKYEPGDSIENFASGLSCWEKVQGCIYPALISAEENTELLRELVSGRFLDMAVIYIIRGDFGEYGNAHVKITDSLLQRYGISQKELHEQAVSNLEKDGYHFRSMENVLISILLDDNDLADKLVTNSTFEAGKMYILSNSQKAWGAAGLLDLELLKRTLGNKSCFILPSSIHETIFLPVADGISGEELSRMVREVNETQVEVSDRLSNHCYVYDGVDGSVKMCA